MLLPRAARATESIGVRKEKRVLDELTSGPRPPVKEPVQAVNLAMDEIVPSPFQVRQDFPEEEIRSLADSIQHQGQIMPIVVRVNKACTNGAGHFELIDGERRWRAICRLGWTTIQAEIQQHTDAQARAIVLASALQRKDLNAIERAQAMRQAIDAGDAKGPTELARQLGLAQGTVSNLLRLLELPQAWQRRVISGEMSERHARAILPWKDCPLIMDEIERFTRGEGTVDGPWNFAEHTVADFEEELVRVAVEDNTRPMDGPSGDGQDYDTKRGRRVAIFTPSAEQEKTLGIVTFNEERRATNVALWEQLQEAFLAGQAKDGDSETAGTTPDKPKKAAKPDPEAQARQYAQRLYDFQIDWLRWLIVDQVRSLASESELLALLVFVSIEKDIGWIDFNAECQRAGIKRRRPKSGETTEMTSLLSLMADPLGKGPVAVAGGIVAQMFWNEEGPRKDTFDDLEVEQIALALGIDLEECWVSTQCGPLSQRYWELHTAEQLYTLGRQLGVHGKLPVAAKKGDLVKAFLDLKPTQTKQIPRELAKIKRPK